MKMPGSSCEVASWSRSPVTKIARCDVVQNTGCDDWKSAFEVLVAAAMVWLASSFSQ